MREAIQRSRVSGFLRAEGMELRNGRDEQVLLLGWGLGNWLLCEGYMWGMGEFPRFDRPRRIEQTLVTLTGERYAARFWQRYRDAYISDQDLAMMAEMGYNSVRIPIAARLFVAEGPRLRFLEEGFARLDTLLDRCEKHGLYAFIDLHGAPGGQTGANIDDSIDDRCRLFIDEAQFERGLDLWEELARRYRDRWIVGGYDLLNEPIRPVRFPGDENLDDHEPKLRRFYEAAIERIRRHDQRHLIALEGMHWATDMSIFDRVYDDNMVLQFHCYGCPPDIDALQPAMNTARRLNVPVWLGETGENTLEWLSALIPLALDLGISVSLWPWKKMGGDNSPCTIREPEEWPLLREYLQGGTQPDYEVAQKCFDHLLENLRVENCRIDGAIFPHLLRRPGCVIQGTDFDEFPGPGFSYYSEDRHEPGSYRRKTGMEIVQKADEEKRFYFDGPWRTAALRLNKGEWAQYTLHDMTADTHLEVACHAGTTSRLEICQSGKTLGVFDLSGCDVPQVLSGMRLFALERCVLRLTVLSGKIDIIRLEARSEGGDG